MAAFVTRDPPDCAGFQAFRDRILNDPNIVIRAIRSREAFILHVVTGCVACSRNPPLHTDCLRHTLTSRLVMDGLDGVAGLAGYNSSGP